MVKNPAAVDQYWEQEGTSCSSSWVCGVQPSMCVYCCRGDNTTTATYYFSSIEITTASVRLTSLEFIDRVFYWLFPSRLVYLSARKCADQKACERFPSEWSSSCFEWALGFNDRSRSGAVECFVSIAWQPPHRACVRFLLDVPLLYSAMMNQELELSRSYLTACI